MIGARPGELAAADDAALRAHLAGCDACSALAADVWATKGLVSDALLAAANRRDFAPFVDAVMARVEKQASRAAGALEPARAERGRANGAAEPRHARAPRAGILAWLSGHRRAAAGALAPVLAAAALLVYVRLEADRGQIASLELAAEGEVTMILQTSDGPVVLLSGSES
jgi:hypothetical protein